MRAFLARLGLVALTFLASGCGASEVVASAPVVTGPAPALDGTWDFVYPRGAADCPGTMTIDGATGQGTFSACRSVTGSVAATGDATHEVVILFSPAGLEQFWIRGALTTPTQVDGLIYGPSWNGQQAFVAHHR